MSFLLLAVGLVSASWADAPYSDPDSGAPLKHLTLEQLGHVEVTTASKEPVQVWRTPAAIYVLTQEDIRRSGQQAFPKCFGSCPASR